VQESAFKEALQQCIESIHTKDSNIINLWQHRHVQSDFDSDERL
jgi:hypothetical protein